MSFTSLLCALRLHRWMYGRVRNALIDVEVRDCARCQRREQKSLHVALWL